MTKVIEIEGLSKRFLLQHALAKATTLKAAVGDTCAHWWRKLRGNADPRQEEEFWALRDVNVAIEAGSRVGIIGNNGAGKSTLLKILSRIIPPTHGSVHMRGRVASLLEVGTGFHPELTGRENIYLNGAILGMAAREIDARFDAIVAFADIEKFLDTPVKRYSSGMFARLGFSIAAHLDPDILIVDEVLSVGDLSFQERCLSKLDALSGTGKTILFVSHNLGAVLGLCDRGIYLQNGRVAAAGPIADCVSTYLKHAKTLQNVWEGDLGDERIRLRRFSVEGSTAMRDYYLQGETVTVTLDVDIRESVQGLIFGFDLLSSYGYAVASARTSEHTTLQKNLESPGHYRLSFTMSTLALRQGEYRIAAVCVVHNDRQLIGDQVVLMLPIYPSSDDERFRHPHRGPGLFLGDDWRLQHG